MRPPGYEPGELPTAPLRDVLFSECKGTSFFSIDQIIEMNFACFRSILDLCKERFAVLSILLPLFTG